MTTRNNQAALDLVNSTDRVRLAGYSGWQGDFRHEDAWECRDINEELSWLVSCAAGGAGSHREVMNLSKKEVRPGLFELYMDSRYRGHYTLYKYSGVFVPEAVEEFANGWYLKHNG